MGPDEVKLFLSETLAGRYRPAKYLGSGAFSGVFSGVDSSGGEAVALKILQLGRCVAGSAAVQEFQDEIELLRALQHRDGVIDVLDSGQHTVTLAHPGTGLSFPVTTEFAVLELAVISLAELLLSSPGLDWPSRMTLYRNVVKGVHQMHLDRVVHRDVKAENGLIFEPAIAKIADLGRAHDTKQAPRFSFDDYLAGRGDPRFAPFEFLWLQGTQDPADQARADLFLLGALLFEVATSTYFTSVVAGDPIAMIHRSAALPEPARAREFAARAAWLRERAEPAYENFAAEVPPAIRQRTVALLRMLTDPDPFRRLPTFHGGRRRVDAWDLGWLLERIDGLRRGIDQTFRKDYLARRPRGGARPRHGARRR